MPKSGLKSQLLCWSLSCMVIMNNGNPVPHYLSWIHSKCLFNDNMLLCWDFNSKELLKNLNMVVTKVVDFKPISELCIGV